MPMASVPGQRLDRAGCVVCSTRHSRLDVSRMRSSRYLCWFSLFAYLWVAVGLSEIALMGWLAADHHEVSASVGEHGGLQVVLHHQSDHLSVAYAMADTEDHADHVLNLPDQSDALVTASAAKMAKEVKAAKVWLSATPIFLSQIHTIFSRITLVEQHPPPPSRNQTLSFFRTILLLV